MNDTHRGPFVLVRAGGTTVSVRPDRGAIVTHVNVNGAELLYLEEQTLDSPSGAVRGGVPLLFPFAGELAGGVLGATGTEFPRHGFARRKAWRVIEHTPSRLTMRLPIDDEIRRQYPLQFDVTEQVTALDRGVRIDLIVENYGARPLPVAPGWHPYFPCPSGRKYDCLAGVLGQAAPARVEPFACDVNVLAPDARTTFDLPDLGRIALSFSSNLETLEIWTLPEKDFVCVEPWVGPSNAINRPGGPAVPPSGRAHFWMAIEKH